MKSTNTPNAVCPNCETRVDYASSMTGLHTPSVGDFSICLTCGCVVRFGQGMTLSRSSITEAKRLLRPHLLRKFKQARDLILARIGN